MKSSNYQGGIGATYGLSKCIIDVIKGMGCFKKVKIYCFLFGGYFSSNKSSGNAEDPDVNYIGIVKSGT